MNGSTEKRNNEVTHITEEDVKIILASDINYKECVLENFTVHHASDKMLGFLADYWKLTAIITQKDNEKKVLSFFIKAVSRSNESKANMVKELNLFDKELTYYTVIKNDFDITGLKPWSAKFITALDNAIVFQDLNLMQYKLRDKFKRFDMSHTLQALRTLANFHASSIIYEENRRKQLQRSYQICEDYKQFFDVGGYKDGDSWFEQCKKGTLEGIRMFSKHGNDQYTMKKIDKCWDNAWSSAMAAGTFSSKYRNVICHRDLWNNNILFHYNELDDPDDCVLVDFQASCFQPPAGDVMQLLYCNLDPTFREDNISMFLNYYYQELKNILYSYDLDIDKVLPKEEYLMSIDDCQLWGLVTCACLIQVFWIDDDLTTKIFSDSANFVEILSKDKVTFITKMMQSNTDYKENVLAIFDEIVERYCISSG